jgi:hypothetical protein
LAALTTAKLPRREGAATATAAKDAIMVSDAIAFALLGLLVVTVVDWWCCVWTWIARALWESFWRRACTAWL